MIAGFLGEAHLRAHLEVLELATDDAILVEVDKSTIVSLDTSGTLLRFELADPALCRTGMGLHIASPLTLSVLELAPGSAKYIAECDVGIFVRAVGVMSARDRDFGIGKRRALARAPSDER